MDFLQRLAATALGESGSLRAALPARYAPAPVEPAELESPLPAPPQSPPAAAPAAVSTADVVRPAGDREAPRAASERTSAPRSDARDRAPSSRVTRDATAPAASGHELRSSVASESATQDHHPMPATITPAAPSEAGSPGEVAVVLNAAPARVPRSAPAARAAPLDASLLALHAERRSAEVAPVIHVTIDRIDVRAPSQAPARSDKPAAARPTPNRSLADYLRGPSK